MNTNLNIMNDTIHQGATYINDITIKDPGNLTSQQLRDLTESGALALAGVDLTSATITAKLRERFDDPTPLAIFNITNTDLPNGQFSISIDSSVTVDFDFDEAFYDVDIDYTSRVDNVLNGTLFLQRTTNR